MATERLKAAIRFLDRDRLDYSTSEPASEASSAALRMHHALTFDSGCELSETALFIIGAVLAGTIWLVLIYSVVMGLGS